MGRIGSGVRASATFQKIPRRVGNKRGFYDGGIGVCLGGVTAYTIMAYSVIVRSNMESGPVQSWSSPCRQQSVQCDCATDGKQSK